MLRGTRRRREGRRRRKSRRRRRREEEVGEGEEEKKKKEKRKREREREASGVYILEAAQVFLSRYSNTQIITITLKETPYKLVVDDIAVLYALNI